MKTLTAGEVKKLLLADEAENAVNIDEINWQIRNPEVKADYYDNGTCLVIADTFRGEDFVKIIPTSRDFIPDPVFRYVSENHPNASVTIDVQKLDEETREDTKELFSEKYHYEKTYTDYLRTDSAVPAVNTAVRPLTETDRDAFVSMEFTRENFRPPQEILFDSYVVRKTGSGVILGYFENGVILGYLAYYKATDAYCDVDYIWVAPSKRQQGIGHMLADAYIAGALTDNTLPIWSNPRTEISSHLALTHGFRLNRETLYFKP